MVGMTDDAGGPDDLAGDDAGGVSAADDAPTFGAAEDELDGHDDFADAREEGQRIERERIVAYLAKHEASAKAVAATVVTEESRVYQTTIAKAMTAMREAIAGEFHWRGDV